MTTFDNNQPQFNDKQLREMYERSQKRIARREAEQPEPPTIGSPMPQSTEGLVQQMGDYYRPVAEAVSDFAVGARQAVTNQMPGAAASVMGQLFEMFPEELQTGATTLLGPVAGPYVRGMAAAPGMTPGRALLGVGGQIQSGLFSVDDNGNLVQLQGEELDAMFHDPDGVAREAGAVAGQVITQVGLSLVPGGQPAALMLAATSAAGSTIDSYYQYTQDQGVEYDPRMGAFVGTVGGVSEFILNKIPGPIRARLALNTGITGIEETVRKTVNRAYIEALRTGDARVGAKIIMSALPGTVKEGVEEGITEALQTGVSAFYRGVGGQDGLTLDEVLEAAAKGALYGGPAGGAITTVGSTVKGSVAARQGRGDRIALSAETTTAADEARIKSRLVDAGLSEADAAKAISGIERARAAGGTRRRREKATEAAEAAPEAAVGAEAVEDPEGVLRAALGDTRDSELTEEQAVQIAADGGLIPNDVDKEYILSGEEGVDPEVGGPRPDMRVDRGAVRDMAVRLVERFPKLAQAIRDKGRLTNRDLALFLPGDEEYLSGRFVKKLVVEQVTNLVNAKSDSDKADAEVDASVAELESVLSAGRTSDGKPLTEDDKDRIRAKIDELTEAETSDPPSSDAIDEVSAAADAVAPVGGLQAMKMSQLLTMAAKLNIRGRTKMRKQDLINAIQAKLDETDPGSDTSSEAEAALAEERMEQLLRDGMGVTEDLERAREAGDPDAERELERQLAEIEAEYNELSGYSTDAGDPTIETQARPAPDPEAEADSPVEPSDSTEESPEGVESTGDQYLDVYNRTEGTSGNAKLVTDDDLGPVARKALAFARRLSPGAEVVAYSDESGSARGFSVDGRIYIRVGTKKSEQAAANRGGRRYQRMLNRALLDSYVQTIMHENVHVMDDGTTRDGALAAVDAVIGGLTEDQQNRAIVLLQGASYDERERNRRELRAEFLTDIDATRRAGLRSLYDADASAFQRGLDRLRRLVTKIRAPKSFERLVTDYYQQVTTEVMSSSTPRTRTEGDAADIEMQARGRHNPVQHVRDSAAGYAESAGIEYDESASREGVVSVDVDRAKAIADLYNRLPNAIDDKALLKSYAAMASETIAQYEYLKSQGYQMVPWGSPGQPYQNSSEMIADVRDNKHIYYFKTLNEDEASFGSEPEMMAEMLKQNPLMKRAGGRVLDSEGREYDQTVNDLFRAVHDVFGHAKEGHQFGPRGEENAWRQHVRMFTPAARRAMTSETRGQNSWVNYGPHLRRPDGSLPSPGDDDFIHPADRPYADQKIVAFPSWVTAEQGLDVEEWPDRQVETPIEFQKRAAIHVGGRTAKGAIITEDLRDAIPEQLRNGGFELPYVRGQTATLLHGTDAHDRRLRNVRVTYPVGEFSMDDMKSIREQAVKDLRGIAPAGVKDASAMFTSPANMVGFIGGRNDVLPAGRSIISGFPVFDPLVLNSSFQDPSLREDKRFWYEASGDAIRSRTIFSPTNNLRIVSDLLSATSPLTPVRDNFLRAYAIAGDVEYQGFSRVALPTVSLVQRALAGQYQRSNSFKASSFGDTMAFLAGEGSTPPMTTNDVWVAFMFGCRTMGNEGKRTGQHAVFNHPYPYLYISLFNARLTEEINKRIRSSPEYAAAQDRLASGEGTLEDEVLVTPWTPWQLQAYPWSHLSDSGTFDEAMDDAIGLLQERNHPAAVTLPDGTSAIDLNIAGESDTFGHTLQPNLEARFDTMATLEVGGADMTRGSERYARKIIDQKLRDPDLSKSDREALLKARNKIYKELNAMLRFLAGSNAGGGFFSMSGMASYITGATSELKLVKTNSLVFELAASMMRGTIQPSDRANIAKFLAEAEAQRVAGADPDMVDPIETDLANQRKFQTVGPRVNPTAGFETVREEVRGKVRKPADEGQDEKASGVRMFNVGFGMTKNGSGQGGYYDGIVSPNLLLSMYAIPKENRETFLRILGHSLGEAAMAASRWYVGDRQSSTHKPVMVFTRTGDVFSADELGPVEQVVDGMGTTYQFMSDTSGGHVIVHGLLEEDTAARLADEIGADMAQTGFAEVLLVDRGDNNYGVDSLLEEFVDVDLAPQSEWRSSLTPTQRDAIGRFGRDEIAAALRGDESFIDRARNESGGVRQATAAAIRSSRSFRVHVAVRELSQRSQRLRDKLDLAVDAARMDAAGVDIEFQRRTQDPESTHFKNWFGNSVVSGRDGKPLIVYHGTAGKEFDEFRSSKANAALGAGAYFTDDEIDAGQYAQRGGRPDARVMRMYLRIEKPFIYKIGETGSRGLIGEIVARHPESDKAKSLADAVTAMVGEGAADEMVYVTDVLKSLGYDGVIGEFLNEGSAVTKSGLKNYYVTFDPRQVKSADFTNDLGPSPSDPRFEYQRRQDVSRPEFRAFFRDSKVVDSDGTPTVVYHGTVSSEWFTKFDRGTQNRFGPGIYWTNSAEFSDRYSVSIDYSEVAYGVARASGRAYPAYLRIENPLIFDSQEHTRWEEALLVARPGIGSEQNIRKAINKLAQEKVPGIDLFGTLPYDEDLAQRMISELRDYSIEYLKSLGYDGIIVDRIRPTGDLKHYVIFDSEQAKSAITTSDDGPIVDDPNIDMQARVTFDEKKGMGSVPYQAARMYSMTKYMTADQFLKLVPSDGLDDSRSANIRKKIEAGESVAPPFLNVQWDDEKKRWSVTGHEGRHRSLAIREIQGDAKFPVHIFLRESDRFEFYKDDGGVPRRRKKVMSREELDAPFIGQRGSSSQLLDVSVRASNVDPSKLPSRGMDMQARVTPELERMQRNRAASKFVSSATAYGIPRGAIVTEFDEDRVAKHVTVYDSDGEERNIIAQYATDYGSPAQWAEDIRDIVVSNPAQYGGWTNVIDMDFEEPYLTDDRGDELLVEYMARGGTEDIENIVKTLREERAEGRPAGMALGHDAKAFGRWFRNSMVVLFADEWHTLATMVEDIQEARGSKLPAKFDPVQGLRLAPGAVAEANRLFRVRTVDRVQQLMRQRGVNNRQLGRFMAASHALERNERIREINSVRSDIHPDDIAKLNCGISDETAMRMLEEHVDDPKAAAIEEIASSLQELSYETAQIAKYAGLITDEDFERITGRYKFYIPMNVTGSEDGQFVTDPVDNVMDRLRRGAGRTGTGTQLDVATGNRKKLKYTLGRKESEATVNAIVDGALAALFNDRMITQTEAINNRIANRLVRLVEKYPTKIMRLATTRDTSERRLDPESDVVITTVKSPESDPTLLPVRLEETREIAGVLHQRGDIVYIKINDEALVEKLGGKAGAQSATKLQAFMHYVVGVPRAFTQLIRFTSTQFLSLGFTFTQPLLDGQTALLASMEQGSMSAKDMVRDMSKRMPAVLSTIAKSEFVSKVRPEMETAGEGAARGPLAEYWDEFRQVGGKQQWFNIATVDGMVKEMSSVVAGDPTSKARRVGKGLKRFTIEMYDVLNTLGDNCWRFSYYVTLRENGVSAEEAAVLARNLTVDFSKKGELGGEMSSLYAFFNASVQGNIRTYQQLFKGLKSGTGPARTGFSFLTALGTLSALALQHIGGDDEDESGVPDYLEQIPEWERRRSIIIPYGRDENGKIQYAKLRLQYGLEIPYLLGFGMVEVAYGRRNPLEVGSDMLTNVVTAFNPLGGTPLDSGHGWLRMAMPDLGDAVTDIVMNRNWQGRQIYYGDTPFQSGGEVRAGVGSAKESFGVDWNATAKLVNWITGGDEAYRGYVDMQPEVWRYLAGTFGGSTLRNIERLTDVALGLYRGSILGEEFPDASDYPVVRRFFGKGPDNPYGTHYYEIRRRVQDADRAAKAYDSQPAKAKEVRSSVDGKPAMVKRMKDAEKMVRKLRARIRDLDDRMRALPRDSAERNRLAIDHTKASERLAEVQRRMVRYYIDRGGEL